MNITKIIKIETEFSRVKCQSLLCFKVEAKEKNAKPHTRVCETTFNRRIDSICEKNEKVLLLF